MLTAIFLLTVSVAVRATVLVPADLGELSREAVAIVLGQVVSVDGQWTDDRRTIETVVTLDSETYLKGHLGQTVQFRVPGGTLGRFRNIVVGAPQFALGQRVIVFLGASGPHVPHILGLTQGVYRLAQDPAGDWVVTPSPVLPGVLGPVVRGSDKRQPVRLPEFARQVRGLIAGGR